MIRGDMLDTTPRERSLLDGGSLAAVAVGAAAGAGVRWVVVEAIPASDGWPWATFAVNLIGAFLLGIVLTVARQRVVSGEHDRVRLGAGTGFCGALTTFSTLAVDTAALGQDGRAALGTTYVVVSIAVGVAAYLAGRSLTRRIAPTN